jgi:uncharacterized protein (DUF488 family)
MSGVNGSVDGGPVVYTVGHSNVTLDAFIALVKAHHIEVLVDVRSSPYSRYVPHFNHDVLKQAVVAAGIKYLYLGQELGGRPREPEFYDEGGHVRYDLLAASPAFKEGIARLLRGLREHLVAIMCNEENPAECHRRLLVGRVLAELGVAVLHIRGDGRIQPEAELSRAESRAASSANQQELAFVAREKPEWKSSRSVSQARPQRDSSES